MEITRKHPEANSPVDAAAMKISAPTKEHQELMRTVGLWDATIRMKMAPDAPWEEEKCTERVTAICGGKWFWSDFEGHMMGMPFEGHSLVGFDTAKSKYVSYWFDSIGAEPELRSPLPGDLEVDVAIVGGGFTVLWTAYYLMLADPSCRVALSKALRCFAVPRRPRPRSNSPRVR